MRRFDDAERRGRLLRRHHLDPTSAAASVAEAARDIVALHATDPASVFLSARARVHDLRLDDVETALYEDRTVVRMLGMRRTLFVVAAEEMPMIEASATRAIAARERRRTIDLLERAEVTADADAWIRRAEALTLEALVARGQAAAAELTKDVPELREKIAYGEGKKWAGAMGLSTRILMLLAADGHIVRGQPRGGWTSSQYRWVPRVAWLGERGDELDVDAARVALVRRWLQAFGPARVEDIKWWTGWNLGDVRRALAEIQPVEVELEGTTGVMLDGDDDVADPVAPAAVFLPSLDPTSMGWKHRAFFLGEHESILFDRFGNAGATVWWDGRVVGGWAQRKDGEIVHRLLDDIGSDGEVAVAAASAGLADWLGDLRMSPRFPSPLNQELVK